MEKAEFLSDVVKATAANKINSAIIFGEYGTGKTMLGASADEIEDYAPVLIVDIEGSAAGVGRIYPNVDIVQADTHAKLEFIKSELLHKEHGYKTVIFDTLNVGQNRAQKIFKALNPTNKYAVWDDLKDWTVNFVREMHAAPFLAIFIAHPQVDKDEMTGKVTITVKLAGSSRNDVPTVPDIIGYMTFETNDDDEVVRVLQVDQHGSPGVVTKNRFGIEHKIYNPSIFEIQKAILNVQDKDDDE